MKLTCLLGLYFQMHKQQRDLNTNNLHACSTRANKKMNKEKNIKTSKYNDTQRREKERERESIEN